LFFFINGRSSIELSQVRVKGVRDNPGNGYSVVICQGIPPVERQIVHVCGILTALPRKTQLKKAFTLAFAKKISYQNYKCIDTFSALGIF